MKCLHQIVLLLQCTFILCQHDGRSSTDAAYQELVDLLNGTCSTPIACDQKQDDHFSKSCRCGRSCVRYGTCCVDSPYRLIPPPKHSATCRPFMGSDYQAFFMVDQCPQQSDGSKSIYQDLCMEEWNGEQDVMPVVPVTSQVTNLVYKNYFCFRCHESGDDYVFWNVKVNFELETEVREECGKVQLKYEDFNQRWSAPVGPGCSFVPVTIDIVPPKLFEHLKIICITDLISSCSENWHDESVRSKCDAYLYATFIDIINKYPQYRNPHCPLCNYERLDKVVCFGGGSGGGLGGKKPFSFTLLIDINRADGDKVGQIQRCGGNDVWDPYFNECRSLTCALPGYTVQDGKCIPP